MKVVVTGSRGFVAHHTIPLLHAAGFEVVPFDLLDGQDICSEAALRAVLTPGCKILNLAAVSRFAHADQDPPEAYRTNVGGVATLLRIAADVGVERVVLASTASVYMPVWCAPITEHHPVSGNSHYGFSKRLGEAMIGLHKVPFVALRYAHIFGRLKWHGGLIDNFLARMRRGAAPILYGGGQSNDFAYVPDIAQANMLALSTPHLNEVFNIGTGEEVTTDQAAEILCELTGYNGPIKARRMLGYAPEWTFRAGLEDMLREDRAP